VDSGTAAEDSRRTAENAEGEKGHSFEAHLELHLALKLYIPAVAL
jgi:hypothetical protein